MTTVTPGDLTAGTWTVDPTRSSITFSTRFLAGKVRGNLSTFGGSIVIAEDGTPTATAEIVVDSLSTGIEKRDEHLRTPDFFDVAQYPTATFRATAVRADGKGYLVDGDFTLHGVTKPITLAVTFTGVQPGTDAGLVAGFKASTVLNRKDFGVDMKTPLNAADAAIGSKVTVAIEIEAVKQG